MKSLILLISILLCTIVLKGQEGYSLDINEENFKYDTSRIVDLSDKLNIYAGFFGKIHSIELNNSDLDKKLIYEPNGKTSIGLGFNYKWIGLSASFSPGFLNSDDDIYGETESLDLQLNLYARSFGVDAYFQYYKGFYLRNPDDFTSWDKESFPLRPDLESFSFGLSSYYFTNHKKFSYKAAYTRTQIQKRNAGSFIVGAFFNMNLAGVPGYITPVEFSDTLSSYYNINGYTTSSIGISAGYTYTVNFLKRFFFNAALVPGLGLRNAEFWSNGETQKQDPTITGSVTLRLALGFEGKRIYAGIRANTFADSYEYESVEISSTAGNIRFYIGKRFNVNKKSHKRNNN